MQNKIVNDVCELLVFEVNEKVIFKIVKQLILVVSCQKMCEAIYHSHEPGNEIVHTCVNGTQNKQMEVLLATFDLNYL